MEGVRTLISAKSEFKFGLCLFSLSVHSSISLKLTRCSHAPLMGRALMRCLAEPEESLHSWLPTCPRTKSFPGRISSGTLHSAMWRQMKQTFCLSAIFSHSCFPFGKQKHEKSQHMLGRTGYTACCPNKALSVPKENVNSYQCFH